MSVKRIIVAVLTAGALTLIPTLASASTVAQGTRTAAYARNGNLHHSRVEAKSQGIYNTETNDTYGRGRAEIVFGAKRLVAYYQRLYEAQAPTHNPTTGALECSGGPAFVLTTLTPSTSRACVRLITANEEDEYDTGGVVLIKTDTETAALAPCLVTKLGLGIRWYTNELGKRGLWSHTFQNQAALPGSCHFLV